MKNSDYDTPTLVTMPRFEDFRGSVEILLEEDMKCPAIFKRAVSTRGVVRGFHWQKEPSLQTKLVYIVKGTICDITIRVDDGWPNLQEMHTITMTANSPQYLYVPANYAHAYQAVTDEAVVMYICLGVYDAAAEFSFHPLKLGIDWPIASPIVSHKDLAGQYRET